MNTLRNVSFLFLLAAFCLQCGSPTPQQPGYADIAPIIYRSCTPCHRPNQVGHFNLMSYDDVRLHANKIVYTTQNRMMPPWPADPHYVQYVGQNILTDKEIGLIAQWVAQGMPKGDSSKWPSLPVFPDRSFLGIPDVQISVKPIQIVGNEKDQFLLIKVPFELPVDTFLRAVEFVPGNTKVVHHVNGDMVRYDYDKKKNVWDGNWVTDIRHDTTIRTAYRNIGLLHDDGSYPTMIKSIVNYLPGVIAQVYPEGIGGWKVNRKNAFLLADLHYGPSDETVWDSSYINLFYARSTPRRPLQEFQMGTLGVSPIVPPLIIPPNKISTYTTSLFIPKDISLITINPHMHLLGKSFHAFALTPSQDTIRLIKIPSWNFNWQYFYTFIHPVKIPAGSTIIVIGEFDNTKDNPFNPFSPPRVVKDNNGSMRTSDEMFQFIVNYLPYVEGDEKISLEASIHSHR